MALEPITRQEKIIAGQDLIPITRMEKFLKQYGGGSGGVTSWNDLTDKPFGEVTTVKEVLAECQPEYVEFNGEAGFALVDSIPVAIGEKYIINWNGTDYSCIGLGVGENVGLGNFSHFGGEDTGEPFCVLVLPTGLGGGYDTQIMSLDGSTTLTISIRQEVTEVKKISGKYVEGMGWSEGNAVTWDGNTDGLDCVDNTYRVSDIAPTAEAIKGAKVKRMFVQDGGLVELDGVVTIVKVITDWCYQIFCDVDQMGTRNIGIVAIRSGEISGIAIPAGIYFAKNEDGEYCSYLSWETIHPIDPKFLPSGGGGTKIYHDSYSGKTYTDEQLANELAFSDAVNVKLPVTIALYSQGSFTGTDVSVVANMVVGTTAYFYYVVPTDESGGFEMFSITVMDKSGPM